MWFLVNLQTFYRKCLAENSHTKESGDTNNSNLSKYLSASPTVPGTSPSNITGGPTTVRSTSTSSAGPACEEPWSYLNEEVLPDLWRIVYWSSQILSWWVRLLKLFKNKVTSFLADKHNRCFRWTHKSRFLLLYICYLEFFCSENIQQSFHFYMYK